MGGKDEEQGGMDEVRGGMDEVQGGMDEEGRCAMSPSQVRHAAPSRSARVAAGVSRAGTVRGRLADRALPRGEAQLSHGADVLRVRGGARQPTEAGGGAGVRAGNVGAFQAPGAGARRTPRLAVGRVRAGDEARVLPAGAATGAAAAAAAAGGGAAEA